MGSKSILLVGVVASILYLYFVLHNITNITSTNSHKSQEIVDVARKTQDNLPSLEEVLSTAKKVSINPENNITVSEKGLFVEESKKVEGQETVEIINDNRISIPAFGFISTVDRNQIVALMSDNDENGTLSKILKKICQKQECIKDLRYEKDVIDALWQEPISDLVQLIADKKVKDGSLFVENNTVKLEGTIDDTKTAAKISQIIQKIKKAELKMENFTKNIIEKLEKNRVKKEVNYEQNEINKLLQSNPIIFKHTSSKITKESKNTLDKILLILKKASYKKIIVSGHTDSSGSKVFNQILSQTRADAVSRYIKRKGIKSNKIIVKAFGSKKPSQTDPLDPKNRRVEILLVKGE